MSFLPEGKWGHEKYVKHNISLIKATLFAFLILLFLSVSIFFMEYIGIRGSYAQNSTINIPTGTSTKEIARILEENKLIQFPLFFRIVSKLSGNDGFYRQGAHKLHSSMKYSQMMDKLKENAPAYEAIRFTVPEGFEAVQIASHLELQGLISKEEFMKSLKGDEFDYKFLKDVRNRENKLEGYLYPDTYEVYKSASAHEIINKMLQRFDEIFLKSYYDRANELDLTVDEVVILASIIEREAKLDIERPIISSVFHNRLRSKSYPYLQSCATVQYILGHRKSVLSISDTKIDSQYNTYIYKGLPIGPISSPGQKSIYAALYPATTDYLFFVANSDGSHIFSKTLSEHNVAIKNAK